VSADDACVEMEPSRRRKKKSIYECNDAWRWNIQKKKKKKKEEE